MLIMIILMLGSIPFSFDPLIIPCSFNGVTKFKNDFPNWFQEWWLFFGAIPKIFCSQIKHVYYYFKKHAMGLIPTPSSQNYFLHIPISNPLDFVLGLCPNTNDTNTLSCVFGKGIQSQVVVKLFSFHFPTTFSHQKLDRSKGSIQYSNTFSNVCYHSKELYSFLKGCSFKALFK